MQLIPQCLPKWPKLAWLAQCYPDGAIQLLHGPAVEVFPELCAEAVWCGDFRAGDFDRTDRVFGTGVRLRDDKVVFVTSGTPMDRLWFRQCAGHTYVSNSLAAICAVAGTSLIESRCYDSDIRTVWGATQCTRLFPVETGEIGVVWFNNLVYDGYQLAEQVKPDTVPTFRSYRDYYEFLLDSARLLARNMNARERRTRIVPFATVSSGYDSPAAALLAKHAGCQQAFTIRDANTLWRGLDSGKAIAKRLGLSCQEYSRTSRAYPWEETVWAGSGRSGLLSWSLFDYSQSVSALFLGCYGDSLWERIPMGDTFIGPIHIELGMGEFRLRAGMLQAVAPFLGMRRANEINAITFSDEMAKWTLYRDYDRPIPRRMLEEACIPRGSCAIRKKDTSHTHAFRWPYSSAAQTSFSHYLESRNLFAPSPLLVALIRRLAHVEGLLHNNLFMRLGIRRRFRPWRRIRGTGLIFQWANEELKQVYIQGLRTSHAQPTGVTEIHTP